MPAKSRIVHHWQLEVFQLAREAAQRFFKLSKRFPKEETYSLTDQGRRAPRAVGALLAEAWRRRKYEAAFVNKLSEAEGEAAETQVWIMHAVDCEYLSKAEGRDLRRLCDRILGKLVNMGNRPQPWLLKKDCERMKLNMRRSESEQAKARRDRPVVPPTHFPAFPPAHFPKKP
jgi:four helix bundle protein